MVLYKIKKKDMNNHIVLFTQPITLLFHHFNTRYNGFIKKKKKKKKVYE